MATKKISATSFPVEFSMNDANLMASPLLFADLDTDGAAPDAATIMRLYSHLIQCIMVWFNNIPIGFLLLALACQGSSSSKGSEKTPVIENDWALSRYMGDGLPYRTEGETQYGPFTIPYTVTVTAGDMVVSESREGSFSIEQVALIDSDTHDLSFDGPMDIVEIDPTSYELTVYPDVLDENGQPMDPFLLSCDLSVTGLHCTGEGLDDLPDWDMRYVVD